MDLYREALDRFSRLVERAKRTDLREPTAFTLASADTEGRPSACTVLLKHVDGRGFVILHQLPLAQGAPAPGQPARGAVLLLADGVRAVDARERGARAPPSVHAA
jgi:pyridoxamine 5'-phosphate oxidase